MNSTSTRLLSTEMPDRAMKPTAAEIENGISRSTKASTPPMHANGTLVNTPEKWFDGKIGQVTLKRNDPERGTYFELMVQTRMDRKRSQKYYTKEDLAKTYSGDTFFNYLHLIQGQNALWGNKATYFNNRVVGNRLGAMWDHFTVPLTPPGG